MKAVRSLLIGSAATAVALTALTAPAAAQYYPGNTGDVIVGSVLNGILRGTYNGGYGGQYMYGGYNYGNDRYAVDQCARATEARLNNRGGWGYGGYGGGGARVTQIESVERTGNGNTRVHGWAGDGGYRGNYGGYGGGYSYNGYVGSAPNIFFNCKVDLRSGRISDLQVYRRNYGRRY